MDTKIPTFSPSQLGTWNRCHFSWYLNYDQKWATTETKSYFIEGNIVHDLLMHYYKNLPLTDHDSCVRIVKQRVGEYLRQAGQDTAKVNLISNMARVTKQYLEDFARVEDTKWEILDAEKHVNILLKTPKGREFYLEGYIDILAREKSTGRIYVWDHKTVGRGRFWTENQLLLDSQTPTYVAALQAVNVPVYGIIINQINKHEYKDPVMLDQLFRRKPIYPTAQELQGRLLQIGQAVDENIDCRESGIFRKFMSKDCDGCFYLDPCLTNLKAPEIPLDSIMAVEFVKKTERKALI